MLVLLSCLHTIDVLSLPVNDVLTARVHGAQIVSLVIDLGQFQIVEEIAAEAFLILIQAAVV